MVADETLANVTVNTQSSIRMGTSGGPVVRIDPLHIAGEPHDAAFVLVTHAHFDHHSPDDIAKVACDGTVLVVPASLAGEAGATFAGRVVTMRAGERIELAPGLAVEAAAAYNQASSYHPKANGWLGYVIDDGGMRYFAMGDTDDTPEARAAAATCDVVFVPIGGTYTMDAREAAAFINATHPRVVVPIHYGSYAGSPADADVFEAAVDPTVTVVRKLTF